MIITNTRYALVGYFITSYPTRAHGIIVVYTGPLLFLVYVNDLPDYTSNGSTLALFADDCELYKTIDSVSSSSSLQNDLVE